MHFEEATQFVWNKSKRVVKAKFVKRYKWFSEATIINKNTWMLFLFAEIQSAWRRFWSSNKKYALFRNVICLLLIEGSNVCLCVCVSVQKRESNRRRSFYIHSDLFEMIHMNCISQYKTLCNMHYKCMWESLLFKADM